MRVALVVAVVSAIGCSGGPTVVAPEQPKSKEHLLKIGVAYGRARVKNGNPPTKVADLTPFLKEQGDPDALLKSPDDGEPYVICYGVDLNKPPAGGGATPVLAYEKTGKDGKRFVLTTMRTVVPLTDAEFKAASFPAGHKP